MHNKQKGNIGEIITIAELTKAGFNVFKELGDFSRIDIIAELDGKLLRVQCKALNPTNNSICIAFKKSGPNKYSYKYKESDFDVLSVVNLDTLECAFLSSEWISKQKTLTLRLDKTKNNQIKHVHWFNDFTINEFFKNWGRSFLTHSF